jgi:DNA-binding GntR family transcriptional regulator
MTLFIGNIDKALRVISTDTKRSDSVVQYVIRAILSNKLNPGVKLSEISLQEEFGFSRNVVREGFVKLVDAGVLVHKKNQSVRVVIPSEEQTKQIFQARKVIENGIMQILLENYLNGNLDVQLIENLIEEEKRLHNKGLNAELTQASCNFHLRLAELCNNQYLVESLQPLILLSALAASVFADKRSGFCSFKEHQDLFEAIKSKDESKTVTAINIHLDNCVDSLDFDLKPKERTSYSHIFN